MCIVDKSVFVTVFAGEHASATGTTDGVGHKAVGKNGSVVANTVDAGCFNTPVILCTDGLKRVIIAHDKEDVHWLFGAFFVG